MQGAAAVAEEALEHRHPPGVDRRARPQQLPHLHQTRLRRRDPAAVWLNRRRKPASRAPGGGKDLRNPGGDFLAAALANAERLHEAEGVYRTVLQMSSDPVMREKEILALFRKLSERSPDNPEHLYMYGFVLRQFGHYEEALVLQHQALEKSQAPAIRAEIAALQNVLSQLAASD